MFYVETNCFHLQIAMCKLIFLLCFELGNNSCNLTMETTEQTVVGFCVLSGGQFFKVTSTGTFD